MKKFINLRTYSHYSIGQSIIQLHNLINHCDVNAVPAVALTDYNNLFASLEFSLLCQQKGIKAILGSVLTVMLENQYSDVLVLAQSRKGYENLMDLISRSYLNIDNRNRVFVTERDLFSLSQDIVLICGQYNSPLEHLYESRKFNLFERLIKKLKDCFRDNLFLELSRTSSNFNVEYENTIISFALSYNIPVVATNCTQFLKKTHIKVLDALICINNSNFLVEEDRRRAHIENYFKNQEEMEKLFSDIPEAINNTELIARKCSFMLEESSPKLPKFCSSYNDEKKMLNDISYEGLNQKICQQNSQNKKNYLERLDYELSIINKMNFAGYFLIVADFIKWAKTHQIPVGPGRGSGAGSLVAWTIGISAIDPIQFGLLFERFLNPQRISMPDFDIDFCQVRRDEVIRYVRDKYGKDNVAHILAFGKLQARAVLRDVGRVLQIPYRQVDNICKMVPNNPANPITLEEAIKLDKQLLYEKQRDPMIQELIDISLALEGINRHISTHAAGVVISPHRLSKSVALYKDLNSEIPAIQYSLKYAEKIGLVKFDFLGLKTLTLISNTRRLIEKEHHHTIDFSRISLNDKKSYEMLSSGKTTGIFQFESAGMKDVIKRIKPDKIEDLIALVSLYRPGPMDNITNYIKRKHNLETVTCLHSRVEKILEETYGIIVYQEQVMKIAQVLANYSLGEADLLRRAMGKKIKKEMEGQKEKFVLGCITNEISEEKANQVFNIVCKFASYGFNKSHAAVYSIISFQTAYLKTHYLLEFMISSLNLEIDNTDKLFIILSESKKFDIKIIAPNINESYSYFMKDKETQGISFGLLAIKGVGEKAIASIIKNRNKQGKFISLLDFLERVISLGINKKTIESLIKSGSLDVFSLTRSTMLMNIDVIIQYYYTLQNRDNKQMALFKIDMNNKKNLVKIYPELSKDQLLKEEFSVFGFYLHNNPLNRYSIFANKLNTSISSDIEKFSNKQKYFKLLGVILSKKIKSTRKGKYAFVQIADLNGIIDAAIFDESLLLDNMSKLRNGNIIFCYLEKKISQGGTRIIIRSLFNIDEYIASLKNISINIIIKSFEEIEIVKRYLDQSKNGILVTISARINNRLILFAGNKLTIQTEILLLLQDLNISMCLN